MKTQLTGRIVSTVFLNGTKGNVFQTILAVPAPDLYSQPDSYKIVSDQAIGNPGEEIRVNCELSGFVKRKPYVDKNTGQPKEFWEQVLTIKVTEKLALAPVAATPRAATGG